MERSLDLIAPLRWALLATAYSNVKAVDSRVEPLLSCVSLEKPDLAAAVSEPCASEDRRYARDGNASPDDEFLDVY